jgi:hypothetical protein
VSVARSTERIGRGRTGPTRSNRIALPAHASNSSSSRHLATASWSSGHGADARLGRLGACRTPSASSPRANTSCIARSLTVKGTCGGFASASPTDRTGGPDGVEYLPCDSWMRTSFPCRSGAGTIRSRGGTATPKPTRGRFSPRIPTTEGRRTMNIAPFRCPFGVEVQGSWATDERHSERAAVGGTRCLSRLAYTTPTSSSSPTRWRARR